MSLTDIPHNSSAAEIIYWAAKTFRKKLAITSSLQTQSLPLLHLVSRICPTNPIFFLDTGFHFEETLEYKKKLIRELGLNIVTLKPMVGHQEFLKRYGKLYSKNPNMCCYLNKVEPLQRALKDYNAWLSGIRRDQTKERENTPVISLDNDSIYKICPMVEWTEKNIEEYILKFDLPRHPLGAYGYRSIGCAPCTKPTALSENPRKGRWSNSGKTECGLHYNIDKTM